MTTSSTIGQVVASLFAKYERQYHDARRAAIATQVALEDLQRTRRPRRSVGLCDAISGRRTRPLLRTRKEL